MTPTHEVTNQVPPLIDYDAAEYAPIRRALSSRSGDSRVDSVMMNSGECWAGLPAFPGEARAGIKGTVE